MITLQYQIEELSATAQQLLKKVDSKILLFYGDLGVGKTTLIKEMVHQLGSPDPASSPTFSIVNEYSTKNGPIYHFDFYRIEDEIEALDLGVEEYFAQDTWVFIEWPEKINSFLPEEAQTIQIERKDHHNSIKF